VSKDRAPLSARSSQSLLVDLYFIAKAVPAKVTDLPKWIAQLQSLHAAYKKALWKEEHA
jgi:hypothetical protein